MAAKQSAKLDRPHKSNRPVSHRHHQRNAKKLQELEQSMEVEARYDIDGFGGGPLLPKWPSANSAFRRNENSAC